MPQECVLFSTVQLLDRISRPFKIFKTPLAIELYGLMIMNNEKHLICKIRYIRQYSKYDMSEIQPEALGRVIAPLHDFAFDVNLVHKKCISRHFRGVFCHFT